MPEPEEPESALVEAICVCGKPILIPAKIWWVDESRGLQITCAADYSCKNHVDVNPNVFLGFEVTQDYFDEPIVPAEVSDKVM
jgi:hypothetical protein